MEYDLQTTFVLIAALLLASIAASKLAIRVGVPALLLFILIGIAIGSEGFGGIEFDNPQLTQSVGVVALVFILFSGGLDTRWQNVRPALKEGLLLSTIGVAITALCVAALMHIFFDFSWEGGILLGATMASTDAAAVFSVLRGKDIKLKGKLTPILELESGSNDPMAVFLSLGMIELITQPEATPIDLISMFVLQMSLGVFMGMALGFAMLAVINRVRLEYDGLYPVLTISFVLLSYGLTTTIGGNGFLAIYLTGLIMGKSDFIHKNSLSNFHDGLAWLMQIAMFIILGLQVFPSDLIDVAGVGILVALFMIFIARPLSVFIALAPVRVDFKEKLFISWVGLRGAAPIILATFSQIAGIDLPLPIFDLVFFVVLASVLLQGTTIGRLASFFGLYNTNLPAPSLMSSLLQNDRFKDYLIEIEIPPDSALVDKRILDLTLPEGTLIVLIRRQAQIIIPQGRSTIMPHDQLLVLASKGNHETIRQRFIENATHSM